MHRMAFFLWNIAGWSGTPYGARTGTWLCHFCRSFFFFCCFFFFFSFFSTSSLSVNNCACLGFFTFKLLILADVASSSAPSRGEKCIEFTQNGQLRLAKLSSFSWRNVSTAAGLLETGDFGRRNCAPEGF